MIYGYCRISTKKQDINRQVRNILEFNSDAKIVQEVYTGTKVLARPEWAKLLVKVKPGDTIIFDEVSRMARDADEGFALYQDLFEKGVSLVFLKERHIDTDSYKEAGKGIVDLSVHTGDTAADELIQDIMKAIRKYIMNKAAKDIELAFIKAEEEVVRLRQRTREGIETARLNGKQIGGIEGKKLTTKKSVICKNTILTHSKDFGGALSDIELMKLTGLARNTYYKYKRELKEALEEAETK